MRIILTGGGTAGHIYPIVAVANELKKNQNIDILYVGSRQGPEKEIAGKSNIPFCGLKVGKRRPYFSLSNFWDLFKTLIGIIEALFIIKKFRPDAIFAKGGYVTFPVLYWASRAKIPVVIHESDAVMGRANVWAAKFAKKICVGFPDKYYQNIDRTKLVFTGIPVREEFFSICKNPKERPNLLVTGGSQGARIINETIKAILPQLLEKYEVWHLAGQRDSKDLKSGQPHYHPQGFSHDMPELLAQADLVVSRAGATTFAEIAAAGRPAILIPLATAAANHQEINAKIYEAAQAAEVILEKNLTPETMLNMINRLMDDKTKREAMSQAAGQFAQKEAAAQISNLLIEVGNGK